MCRISPALEICTALFQFPERNGSSTLESGLADSRFDTSALVPHVRLCCNASVHLRLSIVSMGAALLCNLLEWSFQTA